MTVSASPAATLRAAAERLLALVAAIEPDVVFLRGKSWHAEHEPHRGPVVLQGGQHPADTVQPVRRIADAVSPELAAWIAAMHPGVGKGIASVLLQAADALDGTAVSDDEPVLVLARQILSDEADCA